MLIGFLILTFTVIAFVAVVVWLFFFNIQRSVDDDSTPSITRVLLVALRLAIGWHIFVEGMDKVKSDTWSSAGYLRNATGPLAGTFRGLAGDRLIDKLTLQRDKRNKTQLPPALKAEWQNYLEAFKSHYRLNAEQAKEADDLFHKHETVFLEWLRSGTEKVTVPSEQPPPLEVYWTMEERLAEYKKRLNEVERIERDLPQYGSALFEQYGTAKIMANQLRSGMQRDLAERTAAMKELGLRNEKGEVVAAPLKSVLSGDQLEMPSLGNPWNDFWNFSNWTLLDWSDFVVKWGLVITGVCLLAGLFTRTFCVIGAMFVFMFYLAMPPLPWWPAPPQAEGHYLYVNKNTIEMLALLTLASTLSGRWVGIDGLLHVIWRAVFPREPQPAPAKPDPKTSEPVPEGEKPATPVTDPSSKSEEIQHVP